MSNRRKQDKHKPASRGRTNRGIRAPDISDVALVSPQFLDDIRRASIEAQRVTDWFAFDPMGCIEDRAAQEVLRSLQHPFRPWVVVPDEEYKKRIRKQAEPGAKTLVRKGKSAGSVS